MSAQPVDVLAAPCGYHGYEFGAGSYPDSVCIDGRLHDADHCDDNGNIYLGDEDIPCPICRPLAAIEWHAERSGLFVEGCESEKEAWARSRDAAISLVTDIRLNRGIETDLVALARVQGGAA